MVSLCILEANNPSRAETQQRPRMRFALEALISILFKTSTTKLNRRGERISLSKLFTIYQKVPLIALLSLTPTEPFMVMALIEAITLGQKPLF